VTGTPTKPRRARLVPAKRVRGGTAGILAAIEAGKIDPLARSPEPDLGFVLWTAAERRARELREHRRRREACKRNPF